MRILLLSIFLLSFLKASSDQIIIVGTFGVKKYAIETKNTLSNSFKKSKEISSLQQKYEFEVKFKKNGSYYIVTIEPIDNQSLLKTLLEFTKKVEKDAYIFLPKKIKKSINSDNDNDNDEDIYDEIENNQSDSIQEYIDSEIKEDMTRNIDEIVEYPNFVENNYTNSASNGDTIESSVQKKEIINQKDVIVENSHNKGKVMSVTTFESKSELESFLENIGLSQMEFFAAIAILVLIILFIIYKKTQKPKRELGDIILENSAQEDEFDNDDEEPVVVVEDDFDNVDDISKNDSFNTEEETSIEELQETFSPPIVENNNSINRKLRNAPAHSSKIDKSAFKDFSGVKIIMAEDNIINQKVLNGMLNESGIELILAEDGQVCLNILRSRDDIDLVLMDAHMPIMDGFQATIEIRKDSSISHVPVVALSGDVASDDIKHMKSVGMDDTLAKPVIMEKLYDMIYIYTDFLSSTPVEAPKVKSIAKEKTDGMMELNIDQGIDICGGDEDMYKELLSEFAQSYSNSTKEVVTLLNAKKIDETINHLIDVKGVVSNLGSAQYASFIESFIVALKDKNVADIKSLFKEYSSHMKKLFIDIKEYENS